MDGAGRGEGVSSGHQPWSRVETRPLLDRLDGCLYRRPEGYRKVNSQNVRTRLPAKSLPPPFLARKRTRDSRCTGRHAERRDPRPGQVHHDVNVRRRPDPDWDSRALERTDASGIEEGSGDSSGSRGCLSCDNTDWSVDRHTLALAPRDGDHGVRRPIADRDRDIRSGSAASLIRWSRWRGGGGKADATRRRVPWMRAEQERHSPATI
jgi:hypothetical protein